MQRIPVLFLLLISFPIYGQVTEIQWASSLEYQYNQYNETEFTGQQALGSPNAFPPGRLSKNAFRLSTESGFGTLVLGFDQRQYVRQVVIVENNEPGRIDKVKLIDETGEYHTIYQGTPLALEEDFRTLVLSLPKTIYKVKAIELSINSISAPGFCQVDAVGILAEGNLDDVRKLLSGANFNVSQEITFTASKQKLSKKINSRFTEAKPLVSHDGKTLFFSRMFSPDNTGGWSDPQDIYYSKFILGEWTEAANINSPLNDGYSNGVCSISPDGLSLLVINGYDAQGNVVPGVSISKKTPYGWGRPQQVEIGDFKNTSKFQDFYMAADQSAILMAVERPGSYGRQDLFVSLRQGPNRYSDPVNLGMTINTEAAEFAPFLSADNTTLYFASEGHGGYGQSDVFKAKRLDGTWQNWTRPENMGPAVNTPSWEAYFTITAMGDYAYFVSSEGSRTGEENIYKIPLLKGQDPASEPSLYAFQGRVFHADSRLPLEAGITVHKVDQTGTVRTSSDRLTGNYLMYISESDEYIVSIHKNGYFPYTEHIDARTAGDGNIIYREVYLTPVMPGEKLSLNNLHFIQSKAELLDKSYPVLQELIEVLVAYPTLHIELSGHTDALGSAEAKKQLAMERVTRIKEYLVEYGIDKRRIETVAYGGSRPVAPNDTEEHRSKNRRVEVRVLEVGS